MQGTLFSRNAARVQLVANETITGMVEALSSPYITTQKFTSTQEDIWTIYAGVPVDWTDTVPEEAVYSTPGELDCQYLYHGGRKRIQIVQPAEDRWAAQHALRLMRVLLRLQCYQQDVTYLHGGLVQLDGTGICLIGYSKAGKTSTILSLLAHTSAQYVTNDDIALQDTAQGWSGMGWPRSMCIRQDTLQMIAPLSTEGGFNLEQFDHPFNKGNLEYVAVSPPELADVFQRPVLERGPVDVLVFPQFLPREERGARLQQLTPSEAAQLLYDNLVTNPGRFNEFLLPFFAIPTKESLIHVLEKLTATLPCYSLHQSFHSLNEGTQLLQQLARGGVAREI